GHPFAGHLGPGDAVRIATGALLPLGADVVVIQEDCDRDGDTLTLTARLPPPGRHIRAAASDFRAHDTLLAAGSTMTAAAIALALAGGHRSVAVRRSPRISLIDSGDELVAAGAAGPGQVAASNAAMLAAMLAGLPVEVRQQGPIPDRLEALRDALAGCAGDDIVVTTGGASVGDHDLVRPALAALGAELEFWKVAIKPGKPLLVAHRQRAEGGRQLILGLPGNPASAFVTAFLFLLPLVRSALGAAAPLPSTISARSLGILSPAGGRTEFLRARWDGEGVEVLSSQDSGALRSLAAANALIVRPPHAPVVPIGAKVPMHLLHFGGIA
ncbi:MAG: molybdopterin molybdotransferase MoeA, partial [Novosphingobium sp.]